ncbi:MAG: DVU_1553 family AMP-dependent CoA ligase [Solidesulfovibrio sp.]
MQLSPFDPWIAAAIGGKGPHPDPDALAAWQLRALRRTIAHAATSSSFYRQRLAGLPPDFPRSLDQLTEVPTTAPEELTADHLRFLCVSQDAVVRMVSVGTSGTTGPPKRLAFDADDIAATLDCFRVTMTTLSRPGDTVLVMFPAHVPDSVGDLILRCLPLYGARGVAGDPRGDPGRLAEDLLRHQPQCMIVAASQLALAKDDPLVATAARQTLRSVVFASEPLPRDWKVALGACWDCSVFDYYSATEMGYGGGMECEADSGYHLREADHYFEVLDPMTGHPLPPGQVGEVVFTTLTRKAMPLIRYRTGDAARMLPGPCPCGSPLRRLGPIIGRIDRTTDRPRIINPAKGKANRPC